MKNLLILPEFLKNKYFNKIKSPAFAPNSLKGSIHANQNLSFAGDF
jgi:hypothetical protein